MAVYTSAKQDETSFLTPGHEIGVGSSAVTIRMCFYVVYYVLNIIVVAELFSVLLTIPVFLICCFHQLRNRSKYATPQDMMWFVIYMCFVIAPCQSLKLGYFDNEGPVTGLYFDEAEIITAEAIVFVFLLVASVTAALFAKKAGGDDGIVVTEYRMKGGMLLPIFSANVLSFFGYIIIMGGIGNVLADRLARTTPADMAPVAVVFLSLQSISCLFACIYAKCGAKKSPSVVVLTYMIVVASIAMLLVSQNPFNSARFFLLMTWLPVYLVFCGGRIRVFMFYLGAVVGLLMVMPLLNYTGRFGMSVSDAVENINMSEYIFKVPYIDVFDMLVYEVRYLNEVGSFWGAKTLSIILFFVPRAIWHGKETLISLDIGAKLMEMGTAGTDSLSMFVGGEFYADGGYIGVVVGAFFVARLLAAFGINRQMKIDGLDLRSFISMSAAPILIRGTVGAVLPLFFMEMVFLEIMARLVCDGSRFSGDTR